MSSPLVKATVQSCILTVTSNILAQLITAFKTDASYTINWTPVFQFVLFTALSGPPNFLWQIFLESTFPSTYLTPSKSAVEAAATNNEKELDREQKTKEILEPKLNITHTLIKFFADQTLAASVNTFLFSLAFGGFQGLNLAQSIDIAKADFWPLVFAGWKLWPIVSILNYTVVKTVEGRTLVGSLAGVFWGIYVSMYKA